MKTKSTCKHEWKIKRNSLAYSTSGNKYYIKVCKTCKIERTIYPDLLQEFFSIDKLCNQCIHKNNCSNPAMEKVKQCELFVRKKELK